MPPKSIEKESELRPSQIGSAGKTEWGSIVVRSSLNFLLLSLILETSTILNSFLFPVYGSLPASKYHEILQWTALLIACSAHPEWGVSSRAWSRWLSILLLISPSLQLYLFRYSGQLGARKGPLISGLVICFPLTLTAAIAANKRLAPKINDLAVFDGIKHKEIYKEVWIRMVPYVITMSVSLAAYITNIPWRDLLKGTFFARSRLASYYLFAIPQALLFPSKYLLLAALPMLHTTFFSVYTPLPHSNTHLNATLQTHGFSLIARQESLTGYISVLDNTKDGFRVMRCDHSLLGGEWFPQPGHESQLCEPVYAIFVMLEAVRLVQSTDGTGSKQGVEDRDKSALVM